MKITKISFHKTIKKNLGNYNMLEAGFGMEITPDEGETINREKIWEEINQEINIQAGTSDPEWIQDRKKE